jgi:hypothetical protein
MVGFNFSSGIVGRINTDDGLLLPLIDAQLMQSSVVSDGSPLAAFGNEWPTLIRTVASHGPNVHYKHKVFTLPDLGESRRMFGNRHTIDCSIL